MSVFVSNFKPGDGTWTIVHDDATGGSHAGGLAPASVGFGQNADGSANFRMLTITCPVCNAASVHPIGGGAQPPAIQEMFIRKIVHDAIACPCGALPAGRPILLVLAHIKGHVAALEGTERWQLGASIAP